MEFNCPACSTPHAFPDDQIPEGGIVVACTRCAAHVTLSRAGVVDPPASRRSAPPPEPAAPEVEEPPPLESTAVAMETVRPPREPQPPKEEPAASAPPRDVATDGGSPALRKAERAAEKAAKGLSAAASAAREKAKELADAGRRAVDAAADADMPAPGTLAGLSTPKGDTWTLRDLPRAFVGVFDARRVLFTTAGFWAALNVGALLMWLGGWLGAHVGGWLGTTLNVVAIVAQLAVLAFVAAVMGYVCHQVVVEGRASSVKSGVEWAKARLQSVLGAPLAFVAVIAAIALAEGVIGGIGRVPWVGPILWGVASPAVMVGSLAAGVVAVALLYSLPLYIPVIYNEETGPRQTLERLLGLFRTHGFALVGMVLASLLMVAVVFTATIVPALYVCRWLTTFVGAHAMGGNLIGLIMSAPGVFQAFAALGFEPGALAGAGFPDGTNFGHTLGGLLTGLFGGSVLLALVLALMALAHYSSGAIVYAIVTRRKR
jgi:predicted Zn finger-like uncharacterized protein